MAKKLSEQKFFDTFLPLTGKEINLTLLSDGNQLKGKVGNVMFDSFILQTKTGTEIVRYDDLLYFEANS